MAITVVVIIALIALLSGCLDPVIVTKTEVKWHNRPVSCLTLEPPTPPKGESYGFCWGAGSGTDNERMDCEHLNNAAWAEYGKVTLEWINYYVKPTCYEAAVRAGGPQ